MYLSIVHSYAKFHWQCAYIIVRHIFVAGLVSITPPKSRTYEFVLFSVKLFYCCLKARISGCCYVKYANSALSHLQIRQQLWKKQTIPATRGFQRSLSTFPWQLCTLCTLCDYTTNKINNHHVIESTHILVMMYLVVVVGWCRQQ